MSIEDRSWMYQGWHADGRHSEEWARNTTAFVDRAFSVGPNSEKSGVVCPCSDCCNRVRRRRGVMTMHLCKRGFMPGYTRWTEHGELPVSEPRMGHAYNTVDGLDEMLADFGDAMNDDSAEEEPPADAKQRFRFNPAKEHESRKHIGQCCSDLLRSMLYYARITATMEHFRLVVGRKICDKIAGQFYLTREEYINQRITWFKQDCWDALATEWSSAKFRERSEKNHSNRYNDNFKPHKGGSNSIAVIRQKLSIKLGRPVSDIEAWIHTHKGSNPDDVTSLNTREATVCLEKYKSKAIELNGPDFDWLHSPIDVRALYQCDCGRRHGKWATFNGIINDSETLPELKRSRASANAAQRQHREEEQRIRKEAQDSRLAKDYAQQLLEWGRNVQTQNESIQAFMERVVEHTGMAITTVPSLLPPPPPPPIYAASPSPNPSPDNVGTFQSSVGMESPEETISRIANGVFRGHVNATTSGGGTYSPIANDDFPLYD